LAGTPEQPGAGRPPETRWFHILLFPFRALPLVLAPAVALTGLTVAAVLLLPEFQEVEAEQSPWFLLLCSPCLLVPLLVLGYACAGLECVLKHGAAGQALDLFRAWRNPALIIVCAARWLACFLAGPVVPAAGALFFWMYCGEPETLDWLIVGELTVVAVAYWLLVLLAVTWGGRLRDASPVRVVEMVHRLGWPAVIAVLAAGGLALGLGAMAVPTLEELHVHPETALPRLIGCWSGGMFVAVLVFRYLGVCCHRALQSERR
jgi:hypothetical protein